MYQSMHEFMQLKYQTQIDNIARDKASTTQEDSYRQGLICMYHLILSDLEKLCKR